MRISELSSRTGVPIATIKYYLREGLLPAGAAVTATRADYGAEHERRLALVRALIDVVGLSVQQSRVVVGLLDASEGPLFETLGRAISALPPAVAPSADGEYPRAKAVLERLGQVYDPRFTAVAQLERALDAADAAGLPIDDERIDVYGRHVGAIADFDVSRVPADPAEAVAYAVLGTAVYEPVLLALRRLGHQDRASRSLRG